MTGIQQLLAGERAELAGDYPAAASAYRVVTSDGDPAIAAEAFFRLGRVSWRQSRYDVSLEAFRSARALATGADLTELRARVANGIGAVHYAVGSYPAAREAYAEAQSLTHDDAMLGKIILNLGVIANIEGDLPGALGHYERAHRLFEESGDRASTMLALHNRGMVEADLEHWDAADRSFQAALALAEDAGNVDMIARTLVNRSEVLAARGLAREAAEECDRAVAAYARIGDEAGRADALRWRAYALRQVGELDAAERSAREALRIAGQCGSRLLEAEATRELGYLKRAQGDAVAAVRMFERALGHFRDLGGQREIAELEALLA